MFRPNEAHRQEEMYSEVKKLAPVVQQRLEASWAEFFYRETFSHIPEALFKPLYSAEGSRPNVAVNVLVGLLFLKAAFGWSDEEMYDNFCYDLQVRYAVGYRDMTSGYFCLRSYYHFTRRLAEYNEKTGQNLLLTAFEQITQGQLSRLKLFSSHQRMDSSQMSSNIRSYSRLQLLVEIVQRVHRDLSAADQGRLTELFAPYIRESSNHYLYRLKGNYDETLLQLGQVMSQLVTDLAAHYGEQTSYQQLVQVFQEHFSPEPTVRAKVGLELRADSLQSPDDPEATYRHKAGQDYIGYVVNVTETCHPDNPFQLIVAVQTEPNNTDDAAMLQEILPELKKRTDLQELITDGGYNSAPVDETLRTEGVILTQTAIRGRQPDPNTFNLAACEITFDPQTQEPTHLTAPDGQTVPVEPGRKPERFIARWTPAPQLEPTEPTHLVQVVPPPLDPESPIAEPLFPPDPSTPAAPNVPSPPPVFYFSRHDIDLALRRQRTSLFYQTDGNPRAAVESTIAAIKRPFRQGKVPLRGKFRVTMMMLGAAMMVNVRRITRALGTKKGHFPLATPNPFFATAYLVRLFALFRLPPLLQLPPYLA